MNARGNQPGGRAKLAAGSWIGLGVLLAFACNEEEPPAQPGSFDRPTRVAFACFDLKEPEDPQPVALAACDSTLNETTTPTHALHALVVQSSRGEVAAVDLVKGRTLDSREDIPGFTFLPVGEIPTAIVVPAQLEHSKLTYVLSSGARQVTVLKTRAFRKLGAKEQPTLQTLTLPGGSGDAPLDMVLSPEEDALFVSVPTTGRLLRLPIQRCDGSASAPAPADAGSPEPCAEGEIDANGITEVALAQSVSRASAPTHGALSREPYAKVCAYSGSINNRVATVPALPNDAASLTPKPTGLAIDSFCEGDRPCSQRLLVADEALPLIHAIDIDAWRQGATDAAVLPPILTGAPTRSVAVTPRVPVDTSPESAETQYVYAIDARDGSVLVTENGQLLEVGAFGARPDRLTIGSGSSLPIAITLSLLTPAFNVHGAAAQYAVSGEPASDGSDKDEQFCTDSLHPQRSNLRLRGVFLAVGVADGSVRIIDVHDMDLTACRSCTKQRPDCTCPKPNDTSCEDCQFDTWDPYPLVRHRTRIATTVLPQATRVALAPTAQPAFEIDDDLVSVRVTGTTSDPRLRGLACVRCGERQVAAFPDESVTGGAATNDGDAGVDGDDSSGAACDAGSARVCSLADPWDELNDWVARYQGALPGSRSGHGRFNQTSDGVEFVSEGGFCALGVLGEDQLRADDRDRPGDQIVLVGELAPESAIRSAAPHDDDTNADRARAFEDSVVEACKALVSRRDRVEDSSPIAFEIRESSDERLVISPNLTRPLMGADPAFKSTAEFVNKCFGNTLLTYEVRVGSGYLVTDRSGGSYLHRVRAEDGTGRCILDPSQDAKRTARAYEDERFDNGLVTFQISPSRGRPPLDTTLALGLATSTLKTAVNASFAVNEAVIASIPYDLRWSGTNNTLYMVDVASRGLLPIAVDPFPIGGLTVSFQ